MPKSSAAAGTLTRPFHLAVDARDLVRDRRGIGTYTRALLGRFARREDVRLTLLVRTWFPRRLRATLRASLDVDRSASVNVANRVPRDADVVWHPWNGTFFSSAVPAVATVHDLVPFALPDGDARRRLSQQAPFRRSAQSARAIICDSKFTASEARRYLAVETDRLHVVALGVDPIFSPGRLDALPAGLRGRRYVLYVGAHDGHKNVMTLVAAHRAAFQGADPPLVFTCRNPLVPEAVVHEGVDITTLVALYRGAWLVAVPSIYEGFGLPVLEAMASGTPVLASRAASLPEIGGDAIAYVDAPLEVETWRRALRALYTDAAAGETMAARGLVRAAAFRWETCAERTLEILRASAHER